MEITPGINRDLLLRYKAVAERALAGEGGRRVTERVFRTQTLRLKVIEEALKIVP
jgi:hypothetical protein